MNEVEALLARGGWALEDPRPTAAAHPDTFELPTAGELAALGPGSVVRAIFRIVTIADPVRDGAAPYDDHGRPVLVPFGERMWAIVIGREGDVLECAMDNHPFGTHTRLLPNDRVRIPVSHVIATAAPLPDFDEFLAFLARWESDPENPMTDPTTPMDPLAPPRLRRDQQAVVDRSGAPAHPSIPFARVLLSKNVTPDSVPLYGARFEPKPERGDCGWVFFTGPPDLDEVSRTVGFSVVTVQEALGRHPQIQPYLALAPGWGFTLFNDADDLYPVGPST
ncbi:immunity protein Imm33 domain-containing protein [Pseudactinotalea sp.]|uniref:immunity protein Imm33 domain-containing protein n=1 Tax=Pseudactinotalea sp. TaxID=1926260 RepID=UPI003B3A695A